MQTHQNLRKAISMVTIKVQPKALAEAFRIVVWELMKTQTRVRELEKMDKKMHKVTLKMKKAEKEVKKAKPKAAVKVLKSAEKKNEKLVKIDKNVRDPIIKKFKKAKKDMC